MTAPVLTNIGYESGYLGAFTRDQYPGAIPNGVRVIKQNSEPGDGTPTGTKGTVLGSIGHPELSDVMHFVEWDDKPNVAVGVMGHKLQRQEKS